ncbi:aldo/keto reductase [Arcanobacterium hippocoleae]|uniref:aldo/keto reductase n=1 Tax=Arcanobacterium hippocoleae TaxID=149017 RepID=UPI00286CD328|nr:aldo/keto reductase [Arcanobacterium hippocoleae]
MGNSGLRVGEIGIGTLTWGRDTDFDDAHAILGTLLDAGGNLIDISPAYGEGQAPQALGELLQKSYRRNDFVICAHAGWNFLDQQIIGDTGRASLIATVEQLLRSLNTSYLDLLIIDGLELASGQTPIPVNETMQAISTLLQQGKIRYYGLHHFPAWKAALIWQQMQDAHQPTPIAFGAQYSLLCRDIETDLVPFSAYSGQGVLSFAPLAGGVLTGKYQNTIPPTSRAATAHLADTVESFLTDRPRKITQAVVKAADGLGRTPTDVSLAWLLGQPQVNALLCGPRTAAQAEQLLKLDFGILPIQVHEVLSEVSAP